MAHAGNPTQLAQKPMASNPGLWQALLAIVVILALGVGMVLIASNVAAPRSIAAPAVDTYTRVETNRGATTFAAADSSYTQVESNRGGALTADSSYTQVETNRGGALAAPTVRIDPQYGPTTAAAAQILVKTDPQRGPTTAAAAQILVKTDPQRGPTTAAAAQILVGGGAPDAGPGRIVGHRGAQIDQ